MPKLTYVELGRKLFKKSKPQFVELGRKVFSPYIFYLWKFSNFFFFHQPFLLYTKRQHTHTQSWAQRVVSIRDVERTGVTQ
jgi:hypothetical protein